MGRPLANPVVHLELRTTDLEQACAFYTRMFDWSLEPIRSGQRSYLGLELSNAIRGGVVERKWSQPGWLPYVEVSDISEATERARRLGATVSLEPREGPAGWRSALAVPWGAEIALWQPKV